MYELNYYINLLRNSVFKGLNVFQVAVACLVMAAVSASEEEDMLGVPQEKDASRQVFKRATPQGKRVFVASEGF
jgi:hypothetical protein